MKAKPPKLTVTRFIAIIWIISMVAEIGLGFLYNPNIRTPISEQPYPLGTVFVSGFVMSLNLLLNGLYQIFQTYHDQTYSKFNNLCRLFLLCRFYHVCEFPRTPKFGGVVGMGTGVVLNFGVTANRPSFDLAYAKIFGTLNQRFQLF